MRNLKTVFAGLAFSVLASAAHAGAYPEVGDQFRRNDGTRFVVAKVKDQRGDVGDSLVCLRKIGEARNAPCAWHKEKNLRGDWVSVIRR